MRRTVDDNKIMVLFQPCYFAADAPTGNRHEGKPSIALSIARKYINESTTTITNLIFPMIKDKDLLKVQWKTNSQIIADTVHSGKNCVYLTVGDPSLYSTWNYIHNELKKKHQNMIEIL